MDDKLRNVLLLINDDLKYAEAKNLPLITFSGAQLFYLLTFIKTYNMYQILYQYSVCVMFFPVIACICSLISSIPHRRNYNDISNNLLFWHDINRRNYNVYEYLNAFRLKSEQNNSNLIDNDYAERIILISKIAAAKYSWYRLAVNFAIGGLIGILEVLMFSWETGWADNFWTIGGISISIFIILLCRQWKTIEEIIPKYIKTPICRFINR